MIDKSHLFTPFYKDAVPLRNEEMLEALKKNADSGWFDKIFLLIDSEEDWNYFSTCLESFNCNAQTMFGAFCELTKCKIPERPTINVILKLIESVTEEGFRTVNTIANSDIFFPNIHNDEVYSHHINLLENNPDTCYALSRWDYAGGDNYVHFDRADSQDVWMFYGKPKPMNVPYCLGKAGIDNRFAYELQQAGYNVLNPSRTFKTYHLHRSNVRNYIDENGQVIDRVPPPYLLVKPY